MGIYLSVLKQRGLDLLHDIPLWRHPYNLSFEVYRYCGSNHPLRHLQKGQINPLDPFQKRKGLLATEVGD